MGLNAATVWEVRTTGNANNGGGYHTGTSGTDYSQQNSPQYALSGLTSVGAGNTILSSSAAANMVGNIAQAISGTNITPGFYEIVSVNVGVSITFSTNNAAQSIAAGVVASGVINIGGALATIAGPYAAAIGGNIIYVKATASYTVTTTLTLNLVNNTGNGPIIAIGYTATRGDGGKVTFTTATNSVDLVSFIAANGYYFQNFIFSCTAGSPGNGLTAGTTGGIVGGITLENCVVQGFTVGIIGDYNVYYSFAHLVISNCIIQNCTSHGIENAGVVHIFDSLIQNNGGDGFKIGTGNSGVHGPSDFVGSTAYANGGNGINSTGTDGATVTAMYVAVRNSNLVGNTGSGFLGAPTNNQLALFENVIITQNGAYGINFSTAPTAWLVRNLAFYGNTTANRSSGFVVGASATAVGASTDITLSGDPFVSKSTGNFALNNTAGAGAACRAAGFPGVTQGEGTGYIDVGALQSQASGGGGAAGYFIQLNDSFTFNDSVQLGLGLIIGDNQAPNWGDAVTVGFISLAEAFSDTLTLSDSCTVQIFTGFGFSDALSLSDSVELGLGFHFGEQLTLSDSAQILIPLSRSILGDFLTLSDRVGLSLTMAMNFAENLTLSDSIGLGKGYEFSDALTFADACSVQVNTNIQVSVGDSFTFNDTVNVLIPDTLNNYLRRYLNDVIR